MDTTCLPEYADGLVRRISDAENQIGGGLIEEVVQVAEGELKLVDVMAKSEVYVSCLVAVALITYTIADTRCRWDELEEKPPQGQWDYFARDQHTPGSQAPPDK